MKVQISVDLLVELWARTQSLPVDQIDREYVENLIPYLEHALEEGDDVDFKDFLSRPFMSEEESAQAYADQMIRKGYCGGVP